MGYRFVKDGDYVFQYGDSPDNFYIILSGHVAVMTRATIKVTSNDDSFDGSEEETRKRFKKIADLKNGDTFGEMALLGNTNRTASILCEEGTHFIILSATNYRHTL